MLKNLPELFTYFQWSSVAVFVIVLIVYVTGLATNNEYTQIKSINNKFIEDLKNNKSILVDLSKLVVDEKSKSIYFNLLDISLKQIESPEAVDKLTHILYNYNIFSDNFLHEEKRKKLMESINVVLGAKEDPFIKNKFNFEKEAKQKSLYEL